jgi:hypothetical protein
MTSEEMLRARDDREKVLDTVQTLGVRATCREIVRALEAADFDEQRSLTALALCLTLQDLIVTKRGRFLRRQIPC